jgi:hypothetical protein
MGEAKIFESDGFVVTTERFVYGSKIVPLDDISGGAMAFVDRNWTGVFTIAVLGIAALLCGATYGGIILIFIGLLLLVGAYFFLTKLTERTVMLSVGGEALVIKVNTTEIGTNLANAINTGIAGRKQARMNSLQNELSNLPSA